jgi:hypothetical protein
METAPLHQRLAALREAARRREEDIRLRMEWVEARQRELWSRLDRQPEPPAPLIYEEYAAAPDVQAIEPIQAVEPVEPIQPVQVREERRYATRAPSLAPRPAEVLLAQFRDILIDIAAAMADEAEHDRAATDSEPALASAEP